MADPGGTDAGSQEAPAAPPAGLALLLVLAMAQFMVVLEPTMTGYNNSR